MNKHTGASRLILTAICIRALLFLLPHATFAANISVGTIRLQPNLANQIVVFTATGTDTVGGIEFDIQVGDGGSAFGGTDVGPVITSIDLKTGTPFATGLQADPTAFARAAQSTIDIAGTVTLGGSETIATVVFDTSGITSLPQNFPLLLSGVLPSVGPFNTSFVDASLQPTILTNVTNGTIEIVPEPTGFSLAVFGFIAFAALSRRQRSATR